MAVTAVDVTVDVTDDVTDVDADALCDVVAELVKVELADAECVVVAVDEADIVADVVTLLV